ncbi:TetR/AcrR family transcriptional regulator [Saccharopolyspora tripterygii]
MSTSDATTPQRGRPTVLDRAAITTATFRLWAERGYAAVGWKDIAEATGISVRTLVRHFARKSDIAWVGVPAATRRLRGALDEMPAETSTADAVRRAIVASISDVPMSPAGPDWIRVVCTEPEIFGTAPAAYRPWITELAGFLERRVDGIGPAAATSLASGYQAATFAALVAWSESGSHEHAATAADEALSWLSLTPSGSRRDTAES